MLHPSWTLAVTQGQLRISRAEESPLNTLRYLFNDSPLLLFAYAHRVLPSLCCEVLPGGVVSPLRGLSALPPAGGSVGMPCGSGFHPRAAPNYFIPTMVGALFLLVAVAVVLSTCSRPVPTLLVFL